MRIIGTFVVLVGLAISISSEYCVFPAKNMRELMNCIIGIISGIIVILFGMFLLCI